MSYALTMIEQKPGGPELPFSDLGHRVYAKYWANRVVQALINIDEN